MSSIVAFGKPLIEATLIKRYKRFLADVRLDDGRVLTVHCPNSGSMKTCCDAGAPVILSDSRNESRKLRYTLEAIRIGRTWVGVNTMNPNRAVAQWIERNRLPELEGYRSLKREVKYGDRGKSRIDLLLSGDSKPNCFVEVKNATMRIGRHAAFPDAITERGLKHLNELSREVARGNRAVMFFFIGRADCERFRPADEIDAEYGNGLRRVIKAGVEVIAYRARFSPRGIALERRLPLDV